MCSVEVVFGGGGGGECDMDSVEGKKMKKWEASAPVSRATEVCKTQAGWTFYSQCAALPSGKILQTPLMTPKALMAGPAVAAPSLT